MIMLLQETECETLFTAGNSQPSRPVMHYHGGKWRMADWLIGFFPPHFTYVEPYGGSASVLMQKQRSSAEVYNDLDEDVVNLFAVLRDPDKAQALQQQCWLTPYSRTEFEQACQRADEPIERARRTLVRAFAGHGSAGATKGRTGFRSYAGSKRVSTPALDWVHYPQHISAFCARLQGVIVESRPALDIIQQFDAHETLFYVDPPYLHETRQISGGRYYHHEMSDEDHRVLLNALLGIKGMVILSGYAHPLYDRHLIPHRWQRFNKSVQSSGRYGSVSRMESVWVNPACIHRGQQQVLEF